MPSTAHAKRARTHKPAHARKSSHAPKRGKHAPENDGKHAATEASARPRGRFWSGTLSFGLVSIPVELVPTDRPGGVHARWLGPEGTPLTRHYVCPEHEDEVPSEHLVRGYARDKHGKDSAHDYVPISDEELEALDPEKSSDIDLHLFVAADAIDAAYFERGYMLGFGSGAGKAYALLASVMERTGRAGIATFVMRDRQYVIAIFAERGVLSGQTLRFHDELRDPSQLGVHAAKVSASLVERYSKALGALSEHKVDLKELRDIDAERLQKLVDHKAAQHKDVIESAVGDDDASDAERDGQSADVVDLMKLLKQSLHAGSGPATHRPRSQKRAHA